MGLLMQSGGPILLKTFHLIGESVHIVQNSIFLHFIHLDYISKWVSNLHFNYSNRRLAVLYHKNIDKHGQHWLKGFLVEAANVGDQLSGAHQTLTLLLLHICVYMATKSLFCTKAKTLPWKSESQSFCGPDCRLSWFV